MVVILFTYPCPKGEPFSKVLKLILYTYLAVLAILVLRDGIQKAANEADSIQQKELQIIKTATATSGRGEANMFKDEAVSIVPELVEPEYA